MDYAEWCYSAAFEMQRQQLTELTWTDANRNSSSCLAEKWDFGIEANNNLSEADSRKMGTNRVSQTPDSDEWRWCIERLRENNQKTLLLHLCLECSTDSQPLAGNRLLHMSPRSCLHMGLFRQTEPCVHLMNSLYSPFYIRSAVTLSYKFLRYKLFQEVWIFGTTRPKKWFSCMF